jgi:PAS domain S-box-containing protein
MDPSVMTQPVEASAALDLMAQLFELASTSTKPPVEQIDALLQLGCRLLDADAGAVVNCRVERPEVVHFHASDAPMALELLDMINVGVAVLQTTRLLAVAGNSAGRGISLAEDGRFTAAPVFAARGEYGLLCFQCRQGRHLRVSQATQNMLEALARWAGALLERQSQELQRFLSLESYRRIVELAQEGIITVDPDERITLVNAAFCNQLGYTPEQLLGTSLLDLADQQSQHKILQGTTQRMRGVNSAYEVRLKMANGGWRNLLLQASPLLNSRAEYEGAVATYSDITERKLTESVLRGIAQELSGLTGQRLYEALVQRIAQELGVHRVWLGRLEMDPSPRVETLANWQGQGLAPNGIYELAGTPCECVIQQNDVCSFPNDVAEQFPADLALRAQGIQSYLGCPLLSAGGAVLGILSVMDTTPFGDPKLVEQLVTLFQLRASAELERQMAEEKLRDSEDRYRSLLEDSHLAFALWQDRRFLYVNPAFAELLGFERPEQVIGKSIEEYIHPDDWEVMAERYQRRLRGEYVETRFEARLVRRDGRVRWVELNTTLRDYYGAPSIQATASDIHDRRLAEEALRTSEERYRRLVEDMAEGIIVIDRDGAFLFANPAAERIFGVEGGTLAGRLLREFLDDEQRERAGAQRARRKPGDQSNYLLRLTRPDETTREVVVRSSSQYNRRGEYTGAFAIVQDITEQAQAERELQASAERYSDLVESTSDIIIQLDHQWRFTFVNHAAEELFGLPAVELLGHPVIDYAHPDEVGEISDSGRAWLAARRDNVSVECRIVSADGVERHVLWAVHFKYSERGEVQGANCIGHDISRQLELQRRLLAEQKEESMTTLAGGIAHDFNNILMGVLGSASLLRESVSDSSANAEVCDAIITSAKRMSELTGKLLAYARGGLFQPQPFNVNDAVRDSIAMLRGSTPAHVKVEHELEEGLWPVEADPGQINQVLLNLCVNACEAMGEDGGRLHITTRNLTREHSWHCPAHGEHGAGDYIMIEVADTGSGMDEVTLARIFEPFFSTKFQGRGLGLAATMGIVRHHNGCITAESRLGEGTTFRVLLPRGHREVKRQQATGHSRRLGAETVLVVDDEPVVLQTAQRMLERQGYRVLTASGGRDALLLLAREGPLVDLMLIDMHMPNMGGSEMLKRLPGGTQELRILASSGYGADFALEGVDQDRIDGFLQKPYTKDELLGAVRRVLDMPRYDTQGALDDTW